MAALWQIAKFNNTINFFSDWQTFSVHSSSVSIDSTLNFDVEEK